MTLSPEEKQAVKNIRANLDLLDPPAPPVPVIDPRFVLAFDDRFEGGKADPAVWWPPYDNSPGTGGVGRRKGSLCTFRDGNLIVAAERPNSASTDYSKWFSTGLAAGRKSQTFGRYAVRQRASKGAGFWPNLQLWPTEGKQPAEFKGKDGWPGTIEVDIAESPKADRSEAVTTVHFGRNNIQDGETVKGDFTQFNEWVCEWLPDRLEVFLNGASVWRTTDTAQIPITPHHLVVQADMGPWAGKPLPSDPTRMEIEVDYVKQWAFKG